MKGDEKTTVDGSEIPNNNHRLDGGKIPGK